MELPVLLGLVAVGFAVGLFGVVLERLAVMAIGFVIGAPIGASFGTQFVGQGGGGLGPTAVVVVCAVVAGALVAQFVWGLYVFLIMLPGMVGGAFASGAVLGVAPGPGTFVEGVVLLVLLAVGMGVVGLLLVAVDWVYQQLTGGESEVRTDWLVYVLPGLLAGLATVWGVFLTMPDAPVTTRGVAVLLLFCIATVVLVALATFFDLFVRVYRRFSGDGEGRGGGDETPARDRSATAVRSERDGVAPAGFGVETQESETESEEFELPLGPRAQLLWNGLAVGMVLSMFLAAGLGSSVSDLGALASRATTDWPALFVVVATLVGGWLAWTMHLLFVALSTAAAGAAMVVVSLLGRTVFVPSIRALLSRPEPTLARTVESLATLGVEYLALFGLFSVVQVGLLVKTAGEEADQ